MNITNLTGFQAYRIYAHDVVQLLPKFNAQLIFGTQIIELIIGEAHKLWDEITIVKCKSKKDNNAMFKSQ